MTDSIVPLTVIHHRVHLNNFGDVFASLLSILDVDDKLNEDDAHRIVEEVLDEIQVTDYMSFREAAKKVYKNITSQHRFGACKFTLVNIDTNMVVMAWVVGGI